jgi:hypothetical protein
MTGQYNFTTAPTIVKDAYIKYFQFCTAVPYFQTVKRSELHLSLSIFKAPHWEKEYENGFLQGRAFQFSLNDELRRAQIDAFLRAEIARPIGPESGHEEFQGTDQGIREALFETHYIHDTTSWPADLKGTKKTQFFRGSVGFHINDWGFRNGKICTAWDIILEAPKFYLDMFPLVAETSASEVTKDNPRVWAAGAVGLHLAYMVSGLTNEQQIKPYCENYFVLHKKVPKHPEAKTIYQAYKFFETSANRKGNYLGKEDVRGARYSPRSICQFHEQIQERLKAEDPQKSDQQQKDRQDCEKIVHP